MPSLNSTSICEMISEPSSMNMAKVVANMMLHVNESLRRVY